MRIEDRGKMQSRGLDIFVGTLIKTLADLARYFIQWFSEIPFRSLAPFIISLACFCFTFQGFSSRVSTSTETSRGPPPSQHNREKQFSFLEIFHMRVVLFSKIGKSSTVQSLNFLFIMFKFA